MPFSTYFIIMLLDEKDLMKLYLANARPLGTLLRDGKHTPIRALACPLTTSLLTSNEVLFIKN